MEPFLEYAFINWTHEKFFNNVSQLLRVDKVLSEDPITDCLKQLPKLKYTYYEESGHGESQLHEDALEVFRNTLVWHINQDNENTAIWKQYGGQGPKWLRNIIAGINAVIEKGQGPEIRVKLIAATLMNKEKNFPSQSIVDFFDRFKQVAFDKRNESCQRKDDDRVYQEILKARSPNKLPYNDGRPRGADANRPWGLPNPNPKPIHLQGDGDSKDQTDVTPLKEEPDPKRLKLNENAHQQTLNKFFKPTKDTVGTVNNGADANPSRGDKALCDGCGNIHPNPRTEASCHGCYFFRQKHPDFNYEKVSLERLYNWKSLCKSGSRGS